MAESWLKVGEADGMMIPEQIWDRAVHAQHCTLAKARALLRPLAWSMAQFIRLAMNIKNGQNGETPQVVANRYLKQVERRNGRSN